MNRSTNDTRPDKDFGGKEVTVGYVIDSSRKVPTIRLGWKPKHPTERKIGEEKFNGAGGVKEKGETLVRCIQRELWEEFGFWARQKHFKKVAVANFYKKNETTGDFEGPLPCHFYLVEFRRVWTDAELIHKFSMWLKGKLKDVLKVSTFEATKIPYNQMMPADEYILPLILEGKKFEVDVYYNHDRTEVLRKTVPKFVESFTE